MHMHITHAGRKPWYRHKSSARRRQIVMASWLRVLGRFEIFAFVLEEQRNSELSSAVVVRDAFGPMERPAHDLEGSESRGF